MANGWTPERRARQAELIRTWRPWEQAAGPTTAEGKAASSRNAFKGGLRAELEAITRALREHRAALKRIHEE